MEQVGAPHYETESRQLKALYRQFQTDNGKAVSQADRDKPDKRCSERRDLMRCPTCHGAGRVPTDDGEHWLVCPDWHGRGQVVRGNRGGGSDGPG
jgi:hypothetical protein